MSIKIGTRSSSLAMLQAEKIAVALRLSNLPCKICPYTTTADRFLDKPLVDIGGKALFSRELDLALLAGEVDICVHSLKDLESELHPDIKIITTLKRDDPRDMFVLKENRQINHPCPSNLPPHRQPWPFLPEHAVVATCAPRRKAFLLNRRPDLHVVPIRGNIERRLDLMQQHGYDAIVLAAAAFTRSNRSMESSILIEKKDMLPASSQGVIAVVASKHHSQPNVEKALASIHHSPTFLTSQVERNILYALGCNCHSPVAAFAQLSPSQHISVKTAILSHSGDTIYTADDSFPSSHDPRIAGQKIGSKLLQKLSPPFVQSLQLQPNC